ncbi:MAG: FtsQ-type POTRA domain-containing protein [Clostridia bacterium]|nr:FtsQ-type POTRA domain-containing protein [Clostridia bacterium]
MPIKKKQKNKKNKISKNRAVDTTALSKIDNRTNTIRVNVVSNIDTIENKKAKVKAKKTKKAKNIGKEKNKVKKIRPKKTSKILKALGVFVLIVGAGIFLCTTPLFNVTQIEVIGNETVSKEEIISLSQIQLNENMFKNVKVNIKQNIKGNAYIEDVSVKRVLPNKMQISIKERKPRYMIKLLDKFAYINSQGYILEVTNQTKEIPIIEGFTTPEQDIGSGKRLNNDDLNVLEVVLSIESSCEENEISRFITSMNVENTNEYTIYMAEKAKTIHLGNNSNLGTKMLYVKAILEAEEGNEGDIFVNGDLNNGFQPFFRKKV